MRKINKSIQTNTIPAWVKQISNPILQGEKIIPIYAPVLKGNERKYLNDCINTGWISSKGDFVTRFEQYFAEYCGVPFALSTSSGTSALFLALIGAGVSKGDEVIIPTFTMISTAFAVTYLGAKPVFVDCDLKTGNIDHRLIEKAIKKNTKAIIPVHIYGNPAPMQEINKIAKAYKLKVIEDAAEAIGAQYQKMNVGSISDLTIFSLYSNKVVTTGEGGIITIKSKKTFNFLKRINNYAFSDKRHFWHQEIGYNYKLSNLQAAVGLAQIEQIEKTLNQKRKIAQLYYKKLQTVIDQLIPLAQTEHSQSNFWHMAFVLKDKKLNSQKLRSYLARFGIETRSFFIPMHLQPVFSENSNNGEFPNSEYLAENGLLLPSGPGLSEDDIEKICSNIIKFLRK